MGRVLVLDRSVHDVRHGLEAAMGMIRCALRLAWRVLDGSEMIEKQERVGQIRVDARERPAYLETLAFQRHDRVDDAEHGPDGGREVGSVDAR
jgi:hypothetical protein